MNIEYKKASDRDYNYCEKLHHEGMRPYCEPLWGWDNSFQEERYQRLWSPENIEILRMDNLNIGYLETEAKGKSIKITNLFVVPELRNRGIGRKVIDDLILKYKNSMESITLNVLHNNPAKLLYERVGFQFVERDDQILIYKLTL